MGTENILSDLPSVRIGVLLCIPAVVFLAAVDAFGVIALVLAGTELPGNAVDNGNDPLSRHSADRCSGKNINAGNLPVSCASGGLQDSPCKHPKWGTVCWRPRGIDAYGTLRQGDGYYTPVHGL